MASNKQPREQDIQRSILDYLRAKGWFAVKLTTVGVYRKSSDSYIPNPSKGLPDILAIKKGRVILIEVKRKGNELSDNQRRFIEEWIKRGGEARVARGIDDVEDL